MLLKLTAPRLLLATLLFFFTTVASAQQKTVSGRVMGPNNQPVAGASVIVKGTTTGTTTDEDGRFTITVPNDQSSLIISSVGLDALDVSLRGLTNIDVTMTSTGSTLNEVVVTGYSAQRRGDITGSVGVVNAQDLKSLPAANAEQQLQGRVAGVTVTSSPVPGRGATVRIRGFGSFAANDPLYVIDGIQTTSISGLNPNDIETMVVLKDAASASIYGARAANGVVVITTKRGRAGRARVSYNAYYGRQDPGKGFTNLLNPQEMADLVWLAYQNSGQTPPNTQYGSGPKPLLPDYILVGTVGGAGIGPNDPRVNPNLYRLDRNNPQAAYLIMPANKAGTNWFDEVTQNAPMTNHNISVSGGADKSRFFFSLDYFDQDAITIFNYYKRYTGRLNTEFNVKENIRIGENLQVAYNQDNLPSNNEEGSVIAGGYRMQPIIPVFDIMGNFAGTRAPTLGNVTNPYANQFRGRDNVGQGLNIAGNVYAEVDFLRHFTARTSFAGQLGQGNYYFYSFRTYENAELNTGNSFTEGSNRSRNWNWTNQLTFRKTFGNHDIHALAGTEAVEGVFRSMETAVAGLFTDDPIFRSINTGSNVTRAVGSPSTPRSLFSYFGKVEYGFNERYLGSFTIRRDESSVFGEKYRWGTFPAASVAWRISRENFMQDARWIRDLKLRASYGIMGNERPVGATNQFNTYGSAPGNSFYDISGNSTSVTQGFYASFVGNPLAKWESNTTQNYGFDATLFGGKTDITFDYYIKETDDLLFRNAQTATLGAAPFVSPASYNVASMRNNGVDLAITQRAKFGAGTRAIDLDATLTFTTYNNKITAIAPGVDFFETGTGARNGNYIRNAVGRPVSGFFGYKVIGLFRDSADVANSPKQDGAGRGRFKYQDVNGDGKISPDDRTFFGDPNPDFTYGFNLNATFSSFDISMFFYGVQGADRINYVRYWTDFFPSFQGVKSEDLLYNSWSPTNLNAKTPIAENIANFSNNQVANSYYVENGSYFRMKNLTIGYSLPQSLMDRVKIDRLRIYVQGTNLFTATKYTGLDPEVPQSSGDVGFGFDAGAYPNVKQYLIGVNLGF